VSQAVLRRAAHSTGAALSIIEEQGGKQLPDLTDDQWDHGSTDSAIVNVIKRGVPGTTMPGVGGRIPDQDIRSIVSYLRSLHSGR
jgi:mono/diheme cytochrome c family protein